MLDDLAINHLINAQHHKLHLLVSRWNAKKFGAMGSTRSNNRCNHLARYNFQLDSMAQVREGC